MATDHDNPCADLERLFHEPSRLAIMSHLAGAARGAPFTELKEMCELTDGNLSRHLKTLENAGAVRIEKSFVGARPRTTVHLTAEGREGFVAYLDTLEAVLRRAADATRTARKRRRGSVRVRGRTAEA